MTILVAMHETAASHRIADYCHCHKLSGYGRHITPRCECCDRMERRGD
jgi:hypothetical protein